MIIRKFFFKNILFFIATSTLLAQSGTLKIDFFNQMNEEEKESFILSVLQNRDAQLQNFSYEMKHLLENFTPNNEESEFIREDSINLKRLGNKLFLDAAKLDSKQRLQEYQSSWDGAKAKTLLHRPYLEKIYSGTIQDKEDSNFSYRAYNHILGLRILDTPKLTLSEWFGVVLEHNDVYSIDTDIVEQEGKSLLMFKTSVANKYWQWFLDPSRDYMPVRAEVQFKNGDSYSSDSSIVEEAIQVDGLWVPTKVTRKTGTDLSENETVNTYTVSAFTRNTVTDEDFIINYPPGTEVIDTIANIAYKVLPEGGIETLPLYDSSTGEIVQSIEGTINNVITQNTNIENLNDKFNNELATSKVAPVVENEIPTPDPSQKNSIENSNLWIIILAISIGGLFVYGGVKMLKKNKV